MYVFVNPFENDISFIQSTKNKLIFLYEDFVDKLSNETKASRA